MSTALFWAVAKFCRSTVTSDTTLPDATVAIMKAKMIQRIWLLDALFPIEIKRPGYHDEASVVRQTALSLSLNAFGRRLRTSVERLEVSIRGDPGRYSFQGMWH